MAWVAIVPVVILSACEAGDGVRVAIRLPISISADTTWGLSGIKMLNPTFEAATDAITVVGVVPTKSGTTSTSPTICSHGARRGSGKTKVGSGTAVEWPAGVGSKGTTASPAMIGQTKELDGTSNNAYAKQ